MEEVLRLQTEVDKAEKLTCDHITLSSRGGGAC